MSKKILTMLFGCCFFVVFFSTYSFAEDRFIDNDDGTVTDKQMKIMWGKSDNQGDINWHQADKWIKFTFPFSIEKQYDNWRMPTLKELQSLFSDSKAIKGVETVCGKKVQIIPDIQLSCGWVWTSERESITARIFYFKGGHHHQQRLVHQKGHRALAVRDL